MSSRCRRGDHRCRRAGVRCRGRCGGGRRHCRCRRRHGNVAVEGLCQGVEEAVLSAAESVEVVGVDGPDDDAAEALGEDVAGLDLETFFIVVAEPLVSSVPVRTDNLLILGRKNRNSSVS